jgi:hypothetical protein
MAYDITLIPNLPTDSRAAQDLRNYQWRCVQINAAGVRPSGTSVDSGRAFILAGQANSGDPCELASAGNVTRAYAGAAIGVGNWLTVNGSSMVVPVTSVGSGAGIVIGTALTATATINNLISVLVV